MTERRRFAILPSLGIAPSVAQTVRAALDEAIGRAEAAATLADRQPAVAVLDAGCGRVSALAPYRARIGRFVGADIHRPAPGALPHLDAFVEADLCADSDAFPPGSFDLILSSFTVEHFADPPAAFRNLRPWLRPGGTLVVTTVNRRHPFVAAYLDLPSGVRGSLQRVVKATSADAHPLVGACNEPRALRHALDDAGYDDVRVVTVGHLARAWGRRLPTYLLGVLGDLAAARLPDRRSTLVVTARAPGGTPGGSPA